MLITETYREEQATLHAKGDYGTAALLYGVTVEALLRTTGARSVLDYGCGSKRSLQRVLTLPPGTVYDGYDPAVPEYSGSPLPAELVCCIDVLEHIEPALLDNVLDHLAQLCDPYGFFTVHSGPARKVLSDGRNAHLTQEGPDWWMPRLSSRFEVLTLQPIPSGFAVAVRSRQSDTQLPRPGPLVLPRKDVDASSAAASVGTSRATATPRADDAGPPRIAFKYKGQRIVFNTPNDVTVIRVRTILTKEPDTIQWLEGMAQNAVLLDVGANVGMYSLFAAVMRQATVYAFEPESQNYALLNANIEVNQLSGQVLAYPLALSDGARLDRLYLQGFTPGGSCNSFGEEVGFDLKPRGAGFIQGAYSVSIDQLVEDGSMPVPDYIKLDVDGFEHKVLRGASKTLANPKVREIIVELNTHLEEHRSVIEWLQSLGFGYDENQAKGALRKSGTFEGVGEFIFRRSLGPPATDTLNRKFAITTAPTSRGRAVLDHVLQRVAAATVIENPFPYAVIDRIFPDEYYAEMLAHFPKPESLRPIGETGRVGKDNYRDRLVVLFTDEEFGRMSGEQQRFWREFAGWMYSDLFLNLFVLKFQHALEPRLRRILADNPLLRARGDALLVNDQTNYAIGPHTDAPHRLVTFLFYLPKDDSMKDLGTSVYKPKDPNFICWGGPHHPAEQFDLVRTVEFLPNRLLTFPKTERSFHGVEQIHRADVNRPLLINNIRLLNPVTH